MASDGWNDYIQLDTGKWACRWHLGTPKLVGCEHGTELEAALHILAATEARANVAPPPQRLPTIKQPTK